MKSFGQKIIMLQCVLLLVSLSLTACDPATSITGLLEKDDFSGAVERYNQLSDTDDTIIAPFLDELNAVYDGYKNNTIDYDSALTEVNVIAKANDTVIQGACTDTKNKINELNDSRKAYETGLLFEQEDDYKNAIAQYRLVIEDDENYGMATDKITTLSNLERQNALDVAAGFAEEKDYESALKAVKQALDILSDDEKLSQMVTVYTESFVNQVIAKADSLIEEKKLDDAETVLKDALSVIPQNNTITEKLDEISSLKPVGLDTVHVIDSVQYKYVSDGVIDTLGNVYTGVHYFDSVWTSKSFDREPYAIFNLNQEYKHFKGTIFLPENTQAKEVFYVNIYADNQLLLSEKSIAKTDEPIDFNVDVNNCKQLTIKVGVSVYWSNSYEDVCIANAVLDKV